MMKSKIYENRRQRLIAKQVKGVDVLDIGYAKMPNPFLTEFKTVGYDLCRSQSGFHYHEELTGDALHINANLKERKFDTIICGELIEHLEDPIGFTRTLKSHLKKDGILLFSTPNPFGFPLILFEIILSKKYFYTGEHCFLFSPRWMWRIFQNAGFKVIKTKSIGLNLVWAVMPCPRIMSYQLIYVVKINE